MHGMVRLMLLLVLALAANGCDQRDGGESRESNLIVLDSEETGSAGLNMRLEELSRTRNSSSVRVTYQEGDSVPSSLFIVRGLYEIAKDRGFSYWLTLDRNKDSDGNTMYVVGFTNEEDPDIAAEFGDQYSDLNQNDPMHQIQSLEEYDILFNPEKASKVR